MRKQKHHSLKSMPSETLPRATDRRTAPRPFSQACKEEVGCFDDASHLQIQVPPSACDLPSSTFSSVLSLLPFLFSPPYDLCSHFSLNSSPIRLPVFKTSPIISETALNEVNLEKKSVVQHLPPFLSENSFKDAPCLEQSDR